MELPTQRLASWEEPCAVHRSCRAVSLARRFPGPPWAVSAIPEAAHLSSAGNVDSSMPHGPERGVGSGPESNVGASLGEALAALLQRAICLFMEELENIGLSNDGSRLGAAQLERLKLTRESNSSQVTRAHERELQRDLGVMPGEPWSYHRHARDKVLQAASRMFASRWPRVTEWSLQPLTGLHGPGVRRTLSRAPPPDSDASVEISSGSSCARQLMTAKLQDAASKSNSSNTRQGKRSHDIL